MEDLHGYLSTKISIEGQPGQPLYNILYSLDDHFLLFIWKNGLFIRIYKKAFDTGINTDKLTGNEG